jgi:oxygen-independent coproporphyrinogen-3 oxidase
MTEGELAGIMEEIYHHFEIAPNAEITLEANPDDLAPDKLKWWQQQGINRLSVGIQSFFEEDLLWMNRAHNAQQAQLAIPRIRDAGFSNFSIDLIYGVPISSDAKWERNLAIALEYDIPHLSAYALTIETKTALDHFVKKGKVQPATDQQYEAQYQALVKATKAAGMEQYEISNFAKPDFYAKHNTSYWLGVAYLGIGPSAHSFEQGQRRWNVANNTKYAKSLLETEGKYFELELLSEIDQYNEYIMTGLRTIWGVSKQTVLKRFGRTIFEHFEKELAYLAGKNLLQQQNDQVFIRDESRFLSDGIAASLFLIKQ